MHKDSQGAIILTAKDGCVIPVSRMNLVTIFSGSTDTTLVGMSPYCGERALALE